MSTLNLCRNEAKVKVMFKFLILLIYLVFLSTFAFFMSRVLTRVLKVV